MEHIINKDDLNILLLEGVHSSAIEQLNRAGYHNIEALPTALNENELIDKLANIHFLGIRSRTRLSANVLQAASKLMAVGCFCIGTNQVDLEQATEQAIAVFNAPFSNTRSVAELVIAEAILLLRGIPAKNAAAHQGIWQKTAKHAYEIRGKKLGIVGYGNIGSQLSVLAESLGMDVYFYDIVPKLPLGNAKQVAELTTLLEKCDIISLHVPETTETKMMFGPAQFAAMKNHSILINASRGTVVNIDSLVTHLKDEHLLGAAIDVFPTEPRSNEEEFLSPLRDFENVIITPHIGGSTVEAQENIGQEVAKKLITYHNNGSSVASVNFPEVALPAHPGKHRLLHIHRNIPGVMSEINDIFSKNNINISAQYLQTKNRIGYVVIDIDAEYSELALQKLQAVRGTMRTRVLC